MVMVPCTTTIMISVHQAPPCATIRPVGKIPLRLDGLHAQQQETSSWRGRAPFFFVK